MKFNIITKKNSLEKNLVASFSVVAVFAVFFVVVVVCLFDYYNLASTGKIKLKSENLFI